jgi:hypothetical protein
LLIKVFSKCIFQINNEEIVWKSYRVQWKTHSIQISANFLCRLDLTWRDLSPPNAPETKQESKQWNYVTTTKADKVTLVYRDCCRFHILRCKGIFAFSPFPNLKILLVSKQFASINAIKATVKGYFEKIVLWIKWRH